MSEFRQLCLPCGSVVEDCPLDPDVESLVVDTLDINVEILVVISLEPYIESLVVIPLVRNVENPELLMKFYLSQK